MNRKRAKLVVIILIIFVGLLTINLNKSKVKSNNLIAETNNKSFAYFVQNDTGYSEQKSGQIPTGYKINYTKTKCYDYDNEEVTANTTISMNKNKLSVLSSKTVYCKVYLDKQKGTGTQNDPYQIEYIEDLVELSNEVNSGTDYSGMYFALTKNLDFNTNDSYRSYNSRAYGDINNNNKIEAIKTELTTGDGFIPIGIGSYQFMGNFDGKEKTLSNLHIVNNSVNQYIGLFGIIKNSQINNIKITGSTTTNVSAVMGGLIGGTLGNCVLENIHNEVNLINPFGSHSAGGIVGDNNDSLKINNSDNKGNINGGNNAGGLVGYSNGLLTIENSYNSGVITNDKGADAGGLLGRDNSITNNTIIKKSYNKGKVNGGNYIGGLIGLVQGIIEVDSSYNNAVISGLSVTIRTFIGGLIGLKNGDNLSIISKSYNVGNINIGSNMGGIIGASYSSLIIDGCYNMGNIENESTNTDNEIYIGGIIGYASANTAYSWTTSILNSFNSGSLKTQSTGNNNRAGGLIGVCNGYTPVIINIFNSYNAGSLNSYQSNGILRMASVNGASLNINNVYNIGTLSGTSSYEIGVFDSDSSNLKLSMNNVYYDNSKNATNLTYVSGLTGMSLANMKNSNFVNTLNVNKNGINLANIDSNLTGYTLKNWTLGSEGYPILAN